tara:strand:- start:1497 stop:1652 length:156 start_codon:yes stop_codon:yes gene_type:complete
MLTTKNTYLNNKKELLKIVDLMGRNTMRIKNTIVFYVYSDGTVEKVFRLSH